MVPSGSRIMLHKDTEVTILQNLGGSYTVNLYGNLARIANKDADVLGKEPKEPLNELPENATLEEKIWAQLKTCYDPEIPVNIVDLGLIYDCELKPVDEKQFDARITMTLTAPGCGMGPVIAGEVKAKVSMLPEVREATVELVFDPPWDRERMSEEAKLELGMI